MDAQRKQLAELDIILWYANSTKLLMATTPHIHYQTRQHQESCFFFCFFHSNSNFTQTTTHCGLVFTRRLKENYQLVSDEYESKSAVFNHYVNSCRERNLLPTFSSTQFGKLLKRAFPGVLSARKGPRGNSVQHYRNLKRRKTAQVLSLFTAVEDTDIRKQDLLGLLGTQTTLPTVAKPDTTTTFDLKRAFTAKDIKVQTSSEQMEPSSVPLRQQSPCLFTLPNTTDLCHSDSWQSVPSLPPECTYVPASCGCHCQFPVPNQQPTCTPSKPPQPQPQFQSEHVNSFFAPNSHGQCGDLLCNYNLCFYDLSVDNTSSNDDDTGDYFFNLINN